MKPEIKEKWLTALRSDEYKQARNQLKVGDSFCCLGVLCDIYAREVGEKWYDESGDLNDHQFDASVLLATNGSLPYRVMTWAEFPTTSGSLPLCNSRDNDEGLYSLITANDIDNMDFPKIADLVQAFL